MLGRERKIKYAILIAFCVLLAISAVILVKGYREGQLTSIDSLREYIQSYGAWGPIILALLQIILVIIPILPAIVVCPLGAALFGVPIGFLSTYVGCCIGSIGAYFLAYFLGEKFVKLIIPARKFNRYVAWINRKLRYEILLWIIIFLPFTPDHFLCYFSGLIKMKARKFILVILTAKPWVMMAYCVLFAYLIQ